jgi:hypothetical protein
MGVGADNRLDFDWGPGALSGIIDRQKNLARHLRRAKSWEECRESLQRGKPNTFRPGKLWLFTHGTARKGSKKPRSSGNEAGQ